MATKTRKRSKKAILAAQKAFYELVIGDMRERGAVIDNFDTWHLATPLGTLAVTPDSGFAQPSDDPFDHLSCYRKFDDPYVAKLALDNSSVFNSYSGKWNYLAAGYTPADAFAEFQRDIERVMSYRLVGVISLAKAHVAEFLQLDVTQSICDACLAIDNWLDTRGFLDFTRGDNGKQLRLIYVKGREW